MKAISVGFGVFMGIVPIWGFQMLTAIGLSILFRLNKTLVILAANISMPPLIPIVLYLSLLTGAVLMPDNSVAISLTDLTDFDAIQSSFVQYIVGATALAIGSGLLFGFLTYFSLKLFKGRK